MTSKFSLILIAALTMALPSAAFAEGGVKVECWGNCQPVTLGQICDTYSFGSTPVAVACDDTAVGAGWDVACGGPGWLATCRPYGSYSRYDSLAAYCSDGGGFDAIVTCRATEAALLNESALPKKDDGAGKEENE